MSKMTTKRLAMLMVACAITAGIGIPIASVVAAESGQNSQANAATLDAGKLSTQGSKAFQEVALARLALFDGHPDAAQQLIKDAQRNLKLAQTDNSAFMRAEADLHVPPGVTQPSGESAGAGVIAWLPVNGDMVITDNFAAVPVKAKAVTEADSRLKKGDRTGALKTLKLADVNVASSLDVVPLQQTVQRVDATAGLMSAGKYYEAGVVLRKIEHSQRYDWVDENARPAANSGQ